MSGSNIAAMGGSVVRGFHFFMVALQNGTVLQVSARSVCMCVGECELYYVGVRLCVCGSRWVGMCGKVREIAVRACSVCCL